MGEVDQRAALLNTDSQVFFAQWPFQAVCWQLRRAKTSPSGTGKTLRLTYAINLSSLSMPFSNVLDVLLSFSLGGSSLAIARNDFRDSNVTVWGMGGRTAIATFKVDSIIRRLTHSPDGSQFSAEMIDGGFRFFDVSTGNTINQTGREDLSWIPHFNGIPISWNGNVNHLVGRFSGHYERIPLLYFPTEVRISRVTVGSSMFAVECSDGGILLVRS